MKRPSRESAKREPSTADLLGRIASLERRLRAATRVLARTDQEAHALTHDLAEAREQETATSDGLDLV